MDSAKDLLLLWDLIFSWQRSLEYLSTPIYGLPGFLCYAAGPPNIDAS